MRWWILCKILNAAMDDDKLVKLRIKIDDIDQQLLELISERGRCARAVAQVKAELDPDAVFYRPEREAQVLRKVMRNNQGPLDDEQIARLFREIMSSCLALEETLKVAFLGPEGTFTEQAAVRHFGHCARRVPMVTIDEVFREVAAGAVNYGVVPVENSTEGVVSHTLDRFMDFALSICGEVVLPIHHCLLARASRGDQLTRIYSHTQSFAQCRQWLDGHWPGAERVAVNSNAEAARRASQEPHSAAIAGMMAAQTYGLEILAQNIEDRPDNSTRFLIIGKHALPPSGVDKTSVLISMRNQPGALRALLEPFHHHNIDLTRVETRPSRNGAWSYVFFIDFAGHQQDDLVRKVLRQLGDRASECRVLGSYPTEVSDCSLPTR